MKKEIQSPVHIGVVSVIIVSSLLFFSCNPSNNTVKDPYENIQVDTTFATDPPVATDIKLSLLPKPNEFGNVLYEATLPKDKIKANVLAVLVGDSTHIVMHDDGKNGDRIESDGIYSTVMNIDTDSLKAFIQEQAAEGKKLLDSKQPLFEFVGRLEMPLDKATLRSLAEQSEKEINLNSGIALIPVSLVPLFSAVPEVMKHNSLMVTDPKVVTDPKRTFNPCDPNPATQGTAGGAWTFGKLMTDMNNGTPGISPADFVLHWLTTWKTNQTVNSDVITARININNIINT